MVTVIDVSDKRKITINCKVCTLRRMGKIYEIIEFICLSAHKFTKRYEQIFRKFLENVEIITNYTFLGSSESGNFIYIILVCL